MTNLTKADDKGVTSIKPNANISKSTEKERTNREYPEKWMKPFRIAYVEIHRLYVPIKAVSSTAIYRGFPCIPASLPATLWMNCLVDPDTGQNTDNESSCFWRGWFPLNKIAFYWLEARPNDQITSKEDVVLYLRVMDQSIKVQFGIVGNLAVDMM